MNRVHGRISKIKVDGSISMVTIELQDGTPIKAIIIETPDTLDYLRINHQVDILFKETEVIIGPQDASISSVLNRISASITSIDLGPIMCVVHMSTEAGPIKSLTDSDAIELMQLKEGKEVLAMIKVNEIMLTT